MIQKNQQRLKFSAGVVAYYWVDVEVMGMTFMFTKALRLKSAHRDVEPYSDWSIYHIESNKRLNSSFRGYLLPFHECLFSRIEFILSFKDLKVGVLNHSRVVPSQLHLVSWACVKVFQH